jgi:Fic family protein
MECLDAFEKFLHDMPIRMPILLKAALAHVQFETIHPFLDGNGRVGRLLITLLLCVEGALSAPILYLSLYFKTYRQEYYDLLQRVRTHGDWESWLRFFLQGVQETADQATRTAREILTLFKTDRERIAHMGRASGSALRVHERLQSRPLLTVAQAEKELHLSATTIRTALDNLETLGIIREITGKQRYRIYLYDPYLKILDEGTQPLPV